MKNRFKEFLILFLLLCVLTAAATYPMVAHFTSHLAGTSGSVFSGDVYIASWLFWWAEFSQSTLQSSPLSTMFHFFPYSLTLIGEISPLYTFFGAVIAHIFNFVAAYNTRVFLSFIISGITMYICLRRIGGSILGAISGAICFSFSYYHVIRATQGHIDLASTEWYGLYLMPMFLVMMKNVVRPADIVIGGIGLALTGYTDYRNFSQLLQLVGILSLSYVVLAIFFRRYANIVPLSRYVTLTMLLSVIFLLPLIWYSIIQYPISSIVGAVDPNFRPLWTSLIVPPSATFFSWLIHFTRAPIGWVSETEVTYLGIVSVVLIVIDIYTRGIKKIHLFYSTFLLSTGIYIMLIFGGWAVVYTWVYPFYIFRPLIITSRFIVAVQVCLSVLVTLAVTTFETRTALKYRALLWLIPMGIFLDAFVAPIPLVDARVPTVIASLQVHPEGTVLELPLSYRDINQVLGGMDNNILFLHQTGHKKPIMGGYLGIVDKAIWSKIQEDTLLQKLVQCQDAGDCNPLNDSEKERFKKYYQVRYLIIPKRYFEAPIYSYILESFFWNKLASSKDYQIYTLVR